MFGTLLVVLMTGYILSHSAGHSEITRSVARMQCISHYELTQGGKTILSFGADTIMGAACWTDRWALIPSCKGRLLTLFNDSLIRRRYNSAEVRKLLNAHVDTLRKQKMALRNMVSDLEYYSRVHNVRDEGYGMITSFGYRKAQEYQQIVRDLNTLDKVKKAKGLHIAYKVSFRVLYRNSKGQEVQEPCHLVKSLGEHFLIVRTDRGKKPKGVSSQPLSLARRLVLGSCKTVREEILWNQRPDSAGVYIGELNRHFLPEGHGAHIDNDGAYYEGHWSEGRRNGFGFAVAPHRKLRVGEWKDDVYQGERLVYSSERIYGIDISKYQHIMGKHRYAIDWSELRITHLGSLSRKTVSGTVDYPVRYLFIKSTEGSSMLNPYYHRDYTQAKAAGYHVGTYHFFSTRTNASDQARFFIRQSRLEKGDLPPVLDIEPLPSQIRRMGGETVLFNHIRTWLRIVQQHTGVKPILYVSQQFVNQHLNHAPDLKHGYGVWIARYGEYKPDIRLMFWQLCPDGKVRGIQGHVDINVFNGYEGEFKKFLQHALIP